MRTASVAALLSILVITSCRDQQTQVPQRATFVQPLSADDFSFSPPTLRMEDGTRTRLNVTNVGGSLHNLTITSLGIDEDVNPGEVVPVVVEPGSPGTIGFFCKYHKDSGMVGTILVT